MTEDFLKNIESIVTSAGYECVNAGLRTDFGRTKIQVLIDSLGGINVDDCELVSRLLNKFLDENSNLPGLDDKRYYLEVSSPGIERPLFKLDDYKRFQGREVRVRLSSLLEGRKNFTGVINSVEGELVNLSCSDGEKSIPFEIIKGGNLVYRFENENEDKNSSKNKKRGNRKK
ncbi:MAG: ribosome maturation factor RimP [Synergistaceae bacterium]|nr:ribosome maturation factor RimP [Synergistaceae bacterium]